MPQTRVDLTGHTYGCLEVESYFGFEKGRSKWTCRCACGNTVNVAGVNLRSGNTQSCGCLGRNNPLRAKGKYEVEGPRLPQNHKRIHGMSRNG